MNSVEILGHASRALLALVAVLAFTDFLRSHDRPRLDVTLMLASLGVPVLIQYLPASVGDLRWVGILAAMAIVAQPFLLVRLVEDFRQVPRLVVWIAGAGMVLSWVALIVSGQDLPRPVTLAIIGYFFIVEAYASFMFLQGFLTTGGPTQWRMAFAAAGSGLLAAVILLAVSPSGDAEPGGVLPVVRAILPVLTGACYYLAFVPPGWLRRAWQLPELYRYLQALRGIPSADRAVKAGEELCTAACRISGAIASAVYLWDDKQQRFRMTAGAGRAIGQPVFKGNGGLVASVWANGIAASANGAAAMGHEEGELAKAVGAEALQVIPIQSVERPWGVLLIFHARRVLFGERGLNLLCDQYALTLDNAELVERQQQHASELSAAHERTRLVIETAQEAFIAIDATGTIIDWNKEAEKIFGWPREEALGLRLVETVIPEHYREAHRSGFARFLETGEGPFLNSRLELSALNRNRGEFPVELTITPVREADGYIFHAFMHDITERKEATRLLTERTSQLEVANRELEAFTYSVSHDLRAPLRGIDGFSQALLEDYHDKLDAQGADYLKRVRAASQLMGELIDDLLRLSRVSRTEMRHEPVDLSAKAAAIVTALRRRDPERQIEFVISEGITAEGDPGLLQIALENLLENAWKFTSRHPTATVELGTVSHDGTPAYFVRDDGAGFDMTYADKLFGPFQRLHHRTEFEGTGIGLATVQRIINRHGGRVWADAAVEQGATFYFTLS